jgi:hypothetical protein
MVIPYQPLALIFHFCVLARSRILFWSGLKRTIAVVALHFWRSSMEFPLKFPALWITDYLRHRRSACKGVRDEKIDLGIHVLGYRRSTGHV